MKNYLERLRAKAWRTSSSRYNAARRLRRRTSFSAFSLALFSAISVAIVFSQEIYTKSDLYQDNYLTLLSGCLGIFLLAISLFEWGSGTGAKAEALHKNAEEINDFQSKLELVIAQIVNNISSITWDQIDKFCEEYKELKNNCAFNHEPMDDEFFLVQKRNDLQISQFTGNKTFSYIDVLWIKLRWHFSSIFYFVILWIIILILIAKAIWV